MEHIDIPARGYETPCICVRRGWCSASLWSDLSRWEQGFVHPCPLTSRRHHFAAIEMSTLLFTQHTVSPGMSMWFARKKILYNFKISAVWHMTPCSPLKVNGRFEGTHSLRPQFREVSRAWNQAWCLLYACFCLAYSSTLKMGYIPPKRRLVFTGVQGVLSQTTELCIKIVLSSSNPPFTSIIYLQTELLPLLILLQLLFKCSFNLTP
jgi:hypothetical protein